MKSRWKQYGITLTMEEYNAMVGAQGNNCAICKLSVTEHGRALHVDHDHTTGKVRGLLCVRCNHAIGLLKDDPTLFGAAIDYLRQAV